MTSVMCSPWKRIFTLAPLVPLTLISPLHAIETFSKFCHTYIPSLLKCYKNYDIIIITITYY